MSSGSWKPPIGGKQRREKDTSDPDKVLTYRHNKQTFGGRATALSTTALIALYKGEDSDMTSHRLCIACSRLVICCCRSAHQQYARSRQSRKRSSDIHQRVSG